MNTTKLLTAKDVSALLNTSDKLVYAYAKNGILNAITLPHARESKATKRNRSAIRFRLEDVEKFIDSLGRAGLNT